MKNINRLLSVVAVSVAVGLSSGQAVAKLFPPNPGTHVVVAPASDATVTGGKQKSGMDFGGAVGSASKSKK